MGWVHAAVLECCLPGLGDEALDLYVVLLNMCQASLHQQIQGVRAIEHKLWHESRDEGDHPCGHVANSRLRGLVPHLED